MKKLLMIWLLIALMFVAGVSAQPVCREQSGNVSFRDSLLFALSEKSRSEFGKYYLHLYLSSDRNLRGDDIARAEAKIDNLLSGMPKRGKNFKLYVQSVFRFVHGTILRKYVLYPTFHTTLLRGEYDCLTATTVFAMIFEKLSIQYEIVEIKQHIYLIAYDEKDRRVLIESTDPKNGCVLFEADIHERLKEYESKNKSLSDDLLGEGNYVQSVDLMQLAGLHFFNQAVNTYNNADYVKAVDFLKTADIFYPSKRISALMVLSLDAISKNRNLKPEQKIAVMEKYKKHYESMKEYQGIVSAR